MSRADGKKERDRAALSDNAATYRNHAGDEGSYGNEETTVSDSGRGNRGRSEPSRDYSKTVEERHRQIVEKAEKALSQPYRKGETYGYVKKSPKPVKMPPNKHREPEWDDDFIESRHSRKSPRVSDYSSVKRSSENAIDCNEKKSEKKKSGATSADNKEVRRAAKRTAAWRRERREEMKRRKRRRKIGNFATVIIITACLAVFGFSTYMIVDYYKTVGAETETQERIEADIYDPEDPDNENSSTDNTVDNPLNYSNGGDNDSSTPIEYVSTDNVDVKNISFLKVDYSGLKSKNPDVIGYINVPGPSSIYGLPIKTALLQGDDDSYYLTHNAYGEKNSNGCIFLSAGQSTDLASNHNSVIFGHAKNPYAFAGLKYLNNAKRWYSNANYHFIRIETSSGSTIWQIFSWYETTTGSDYARTRSSGGWAQYYKSLQDKNQISELKKFDFTDDDRIITLVTCKGFSGGRVAMHAVLVAEQ